MISKEAALQLIDEIEQVNKVKMRSLSVGEDTEVKFLQRMVDEHPVFRSLPQHIKRALVETPSEDLHRLGNRKTRRLWKREGVVVHAFSGSKEGYTLRRAVHEVGGDKRKIYEFDILHGEEEKYDLSEKGKAYGSLLRLALSGQVKAWVGGPPCRTRSVLRHVQVPGMELPRPVRAWKDDQVYGLKDLSKFEEEQVHTDDVLMWRFLMLYAISELVRRAEDDVQEPVELLIEQPAAPADKEEVVSFWRTEDWKAFEKTYGLQRQTFDQSEFGCSATKPTTLGGSIKVEIPMKGRKGVPRKIEGKTAQQLYKESRDLARWPPLLMRAIAVQIQSQVFRKEVKLRRLSWAEHIAAGHTPFRKDCRVCQEASARDFPHCRSPLPAKVGVLSVDMAGPFHKAEDINQKQAKYLLVGCFTWFAKDQEGEEVQDGHQGEEEAPDEAPQIEDEEAKEAEADEEEPKEDEKEDPKPKRGRPRKPPPSIPHYGGDPPPPLEAIEAWKKDRPEEEPRKDVKIEVRRMCTPLPSRDQHEVLKAIVDFTLRLKADGYTVTQLHSDQGGEFTSDALEEWARCRNILKTTTPGDSPQTNGRAEVSVQLIKSAVKRVLHGSQVGIDRWPLAARFVNEKLRLQQIGRPDKTPKFLAPVLIRKRYWRAHELEPTQEEALYVAPSWVHHGHWIERQNELSLVRMVMTCSAEPPEDQHWIGLEDSLNPIEERRRLRGKIAMHMMTVGDPEAKEGSEDEEEEGTEREETVRLRRVIEEEMSCAIEDDEMVTGTVVDAVARLKEQRLSPKPTAELLQTKIVSQAEVRKNLSAWMASIQAELTSMFDVKKALKRLTPEEAAKALDEDAAECLPSKLVFTLKPSELEPGGKKKSRLLACGNFSTEETAQADLYAGGATAVALRAGLAVASQKKWSGATSDIRTAFLNAPLHPQVSDLQPEEMKKTRRALIRPPPILIQAGLAGKDEMWEAVMAVYGYRKSPRLWSDHRDYTVHRLKIKHPRGTVYFQQLVSEPNLWRLMLQTGPEEDYEKDEMIGLFVVYVDDLLVLSDPPTIELVLAGIREHWELSKPEMVGSEQGTRFLGMELWRWPCGRWMTTQINYTTDLLTRVLGPDSKDWPRKKTHLSKEPEISSDAEVTPQAVKLAQKYVGELVWLSTKCRPDICYAVSRMAAFITRDPAQVEVLARHLWAYLATTLDFGLVFENSSDCRHLNVYTDSSFGDESHGCVLVMFGEALLLWRSSRQGVVSVSTAESELIEVMNGACSGDAVRVVLEEALNQRIIATSFSDSTSALSVITSDTGTWRTRHLRKRAGALRARVVAGDWLIKHLPGAEMPADLGTKALSIEKFNQLRILLGMSQVPIQDDWEMVEKTSDPSGSPTVRNAATALKAIILAAKLAQVRGEGWVEVYKVPMKNLEVEKVEGGGYLIMICTVVLVIGILCGFLMSLCCSDLEIEEGNRERPAFLAQEELRTRNSGTTSTMDLSWVVGGSSSATTQVQPTTRKRTKKGSNSAASSSGPATSARVKASSASSAAQVPAGSGSTSSASSAAQVPAGSGSTSLASSAAQVPAGLGWASSASSISPTPAGSAAAGAAATGGPTPAGSTAAGAAASSMATPAGSAADGAAAASVPIPAGSNSSAAARRAGVRGGNSGNTPGRSGGSPMYITAAGERVHSSRYCHGLRKARQIFEVFYCDGCVPRGHRFVNRMYSTGEGDDLHVSSEHLRAIGRNDPIRHFTPCQVCFCHP